jgi:hypothetical protein
MTRLLYLLLLLLAVAVTSAQESYPHAFPREGAKQLIDNARVTVWDVTWLNGVKHPIHRHRYDMAGVYLRWGPITVTRPDGTVNPQTPAWETPRLLFQRADVTHREEALNPPETPERLVIMTDLKYAANEARPPLSTDQSLPRRAPPALRLAAVSPRYPSQVRQPVQPRRHSESSVRRPCSAGPGRAGLPAAAPGRCPCTRRPSCCD